MRLNAKGFWAKQYATNWTKPQLPEAELAALEAAYLAGMEKMCEHASKLMISLNPEKNIGLAVLIRGIGNAEVDPETGNRIEY